MSLHWHDKPCLYTIPAGVSFVDSLALGIMEMAGDDPMALARFQVLLPTRRACRSLREAFLKISEGKPLLLPRLHPIGDVDEEELSLLLAGMEDELSLPPSLAPLRRQFLLTKLIAARDGYSRGLEQDMMLASALGRLMDQVYTEDLDLRDLPQIVDREKFAQQWQISVDFLSILSEHWPLILQAEGSIDAADRRNRLLKKLAQHWRDNPPGHPVIAAGSTGSIPATAMLLKTIAELPKGCIVLPGLDQGMDEESWVSLDDTHPQATLRHLLGKEVMDVARQDVKPWPFQASKTQHKMAALISEVMRPAETSAQWQKLREKPVVTKDDLGLERYDCANPQEEALIIALAMREALETPRAIAALITPDRKLARRVAMTCRRWGIEIDDSAGTPLSQTPIGIYLRSCIDAVRDDLRPVALLSFLKHALCQPSNIDDWRSKIRGMDRFLMRGPFFGQEFELYEEKLEQAQQKSRLVPLYAAAILKDISRRFSPLTILAHNTKNTTHPVEDWCEAHLRCAEAFSSVGGLWTGQAGEQAAGLFAELRDHAHLLPPVTIGQYLTILEQVMGSIAIRPAYGLHPRLMILGQLEARLVQADVMVLSGLNEKSWPPDPGMDPWMSRPMRKRFGLPPLERSIGLAAHDFAQAFCAPKIILTRSVRVDGTPTVPARWLQRLDTVLEASGIDPDHIRRGPLMIYANKLNHTDEYTPYERPQPRPPISVRPRKLPVTQIEKWMQDPYSIYARYILGLRKLDPLEQKLDAAMRGTLVHTVLDRFVDRFMDDIPSYAHDEFMNITQSELQKIAADDDVIGLWQPRLSKMGDWLIHHEAAWRVVFKPASREAEGMMTIQTSGEDFVLTARADRIDVSRDGNEAAIIDYKSGGQYSGVKMQNGQLPQLPLEALILESGGFNAVKNIPVTNLSYWILHGNKDGGDIKSLADANKLDAAKTNAREGLKTLIEKFDDVATPYYSLPRPHNIPRFNDYEHLARVKEWTAVDEPGEAA